MKLIIHWNKQKKKWTTHTYKSCIQTETILIVGEWFTETKPERKSNPRGWIVTDDKNVILNPSSEVLSKYIKLEQLFYDKKSIQFTINKGNRLLFDKHGCFLIGEII